MPYPGGKHAPGHYSAGQGGGGSFANLPFVLRDQILTFSGVGPFDGGFRFTAGDSTLSQNGGAFIVSVDTLPLQFNTARPGSLPSATSDRFIALFDSTVTAFVFDFPLIGVWRSIGTSPYDMVRPPAGTTEGFTLTIQLGLGLPAAPPTVEAQANIRYEWTRP